MLRRPFPAIAGLLCLLAARSALPDTGGLAWQQRGALLAPALPASAAGWRVPTSSQAQRPGSRAVAWGQARQTDQWPLQLSASVFGERGLTAANAVVLKYRWQLQSRWDTPVQLGLQGTGELGPWRDWLPTGAQAQRLGPALSGTWHGPQGQPLQLQAACLTGLASGRTDNVLSVRVQSAF